LNHAINESVQEKQELGWRHAIENAKCLADWIQKTNLGQSTLWA